MFNLSYEFNLRGEGMTNKIQLDSFALSRELVKALLDFIFSC